MATYFERRRLNALQRTLELAGSFLEAGSTKSLLDVGGGTGWVVEAFARGVPEVTVLEPKASRRAKGAKRHPQLKFVDGVAEKLPFADAAFDRVLATRAFHHFADQAKGLAEIRRVLAPGGRLVIFEFYPDRGQGKFLRRFAFHRTLKMPEELKAMLLRVGFANMAFADAPPGYILRADRP